MHISCIERPYACLKEANRSWRLFDSGKEFVWRSNEHCLLLIGEDGEDYICADPWENHGIVRYDKALMRRRHRAQYMQAVGVRRRG